jgi:enoyl-CoA hydratase/carnithine racemase
MMLCEEPLEPPMALCDSISRTLNLHGLSLVGPDADGVFVLQTEEGKASGFAPETLAAFDRALDVVEQHTGPTAVVIVVDGEFFPKGFSNECPADESAQSRQSLHKLFERMLRLSVPSVAALSGHAFGGGTLTALACDYRIMNADDCYLSVSELDNSIDLSPQMMLLLRAKVPVPALGPLVLGATPLSADEGVRNGVVQAKASAGKVLEQAKLMASSHAAKGVKKQAYRQIKEFLYKDALAGLEVGTSMSTFPPMTMNSLSWSRL